MLLMLFKFNSWKQDKFSALKLCKYFCVVLASREESLLHSCCFHHFTWESSWAKCAYCRMHKIKNIDTMRNVVNNSAAFHYISAPIFVMSQQAVSAAFKTRLLLLKTFPNIWEELAFFYIYYIFILFSSRQMSTQLWYTKTYKTSAPFFSNKKSPDVNSQTAKNIGSTNRKSAKCLIGGRSANLANYLCPKLADLWIKELICGPPIYALHNVSTCSLSQNTFEIQFMLFFWIFAL